MQSEHVPLTIRPGMICTESLGQDTELEAAEYV